MGKKGKQRSERLFQRLEQIAGQGSDEDEEELYLPVHFGHDQVEELTTLGGQVIGMAPDSSRMLRMKKFRFQLLAQWLVTTFSPRRAADIGGGKGLLSYLLIQAGWQAAVIDPVRQALPDKFKDLATGKRVKIGPHEEVPFIEAPFEPAMAKDFDLLIGMHAHGSNVMVIDASVEYGTGFVLFPCCVIDEPFYPRLGVHWLESLAAYAVHKGRPTSHVRLNFKGQNIGLYHVRGEG